MRRSVSLRFIVPLALGAVWASAALAAPTNPPPEHKLAGYSAYELLPVAVEAGIEQKKNAGKVIAKVEENMRASVGPILATWNASADANAANKLVIEPRITTLHKPSGAGRFFAGALQGDGKIVINVRIVEQPSGKVIATPEFYQRASAIAGAWTLGAHDNSMLQRVTALVANYLSGNYNEAVGGATGYEP
ncbi:MAG: hypothetical protein KDI32_03745 [Pseudomonadales bacterium]|nr:hypothetical protein [Pseudomonadales bacterium]